MVSPNDRHAEMARAFRLWQAAKGKREKDKQLVRLLKLCQPEVKRALKDVATKEHSDMAHWLKRRGLSYEEISYAVFPAVKAAAHNFDPEHNSGASFSTFAMGHIKGEVAAIAKKSPPVDSSSSGELEELKEDDQESSDYRSIAESVELTYKYSVSKIVEMVYKETKDTNEHSSGTLRHLADRIEEDCAEELAQNVRVQALHSMLVAQSIRAEDHEGQMLLVSTLAHLLAIRQNRKANGMRRESYSPKVLAKVYGRPSDKTLAKWLKACDEQGITAENWTPELLAKIISSKRGPTFRGPLNN